MKKLLSVLVCMIMIVTALSMQPTWSNADGSSLDEGIALMKAGDEVAAFSAIKKAADEGVTEAFGKLAWMYFTGTGVEYDGWKALSWVQKGVAVNDPESMLLQGWNYTTEMTDSNREKALDIFQKLAELDDPVYRGYALNELGWICASSPENNMEQAIEYYQKAADLGNPNAMLNLADIYGWQYPEYRDYEAALKYYVSCLECTPWDISEHFVAGCNYALDKERLDKDALNDLYYTGYQIREPQDGSKPNYDLALRYHEMAAEYGDARAASWLFYAYNNDDDIGVERNLEKSLKWAKRVLEIHEVSPDEYTNDVADVFNLLVGDCYLHSWGTEQDYSEALNCYIRSYELGNIDALDCIRNGANNLLTGIVVEIDQDIPLALEWYNKAIELGSGEAAYELASFYKYGFQPDDGYNLKSFPINLDKAKEYYDIAESLGHRVEETNE